MSLRGSVGRSVVLAVAVLATLLAGSVTAAPPPSADAAQRGAHHLAGRQGADGSVPDGWRPDQVAEAMVALAAAGNQAAALDRAVNHLRATAPDGASTGPWAGRIVAGLTAAGLDPRGFAGTDFVARTKSFHDPVAGGYHSPNLYSDFIAMAALRTAGESLPDADVRRLRVNQCDDGGWAHREGCLGAPDTDTTASAVMVLASVFPEGDADLGAGRQWLLAAQNDSGCWGMERGQPDNANSCALAIAAIGALGEDPLSAPWTQGSRRPVQALVDLQLPSGGFRYLAKQDEPDDYATVQAVPALAGWHLAAQEQRPLPVGAGGGDRSGAPRQPSTAQPGGGSSTPGAGHPVSLDDQDHSATSTTENDRVAVGDLDRSQAPDVGSLSVGGGGDGDGGLGGAPLAAGFLLAVSGTASSLAWRKGHLGGVRR